MKRIILEAFGFFVRQTYSPTQVEAKGLCTIITRSMTHWVIRYFEWADYS